MPDILVEARQHLRDLAPHVKERQTPQLLLQLVAEVERLQERVKTLEGHLDWVGWGSEGVSKARAELERLRWERDLLALNCRGLPNRIALQVVYDKSGPVVGLALLERDATDDPVVLPKNSEPIPPP